MRAGCDADCLQLPLPRAGRADTDMESENNSLPVHWRQVTMADTQPWGPSSGIQGALATAEPSGWGQSLL